MQKCGKDGESRFFRARGGGLTASGQRRKEVPKALGMYSQISGRTPHLWGAGKGGVPHGAGAAVLGGQPARGQGAGADVALPQVLRLLRKVHQAGNGTASASFKLSA